MTNSKTDPAAAFAVNSPWLTEAEAAEYCRCSVWSFRNMRLPAKNSGGRKVYHRSTLDASIHSRPWQRSTSDEASGTSTSEQTIGKSASLSERLTGKRQRPYKPRKKVHAT